MVIDSSIWLEVFLDGALAEKCSSYLTSKSSIVPTSVIYEVYRKLKSEVSEDMALDAVAFMSSYQVLEINREIALQAADLSIEHNLGFVDSLVLASAMTEKVSLLTLDNVFSDLPQSMVLR